MPGRRTYGMDHEVYAWSPIAKRPVLTWPDGERVGVFRIFDVLDKYGIVPTLALDAMTADNYPYLVAVGKDRGAEFIAHGIGRREIIHAGMSEEQERGYIQMTPKSGELYSLGICAPLDDNYTHVHARRTITELTNSWCGWFDGVYADGVTNGRLRAFRELARCWTGGRARPRR
jgi:hypothetical protein